MLYRFWLFFVSFFTKKIAQAKVFFKLFLAAEQPLNPDKDKQYKRFFTKKEDESKMFYGEIIKINLTDFLNSDLCKGKKRRKRLRCY